MSSNLYDPMFEQLLVNCQSADKLVRETSEQQLLAEAHTNTNTTFEKLLNTTILDTSTNELKLFAILTIRKLITIYWSDTTPSFNGEKYIDDCNLKEKIKQSLLNIAVTKENIDHRIINCARYVIVQIASCDFPDSWPNMIQEILSMLHKGEENSFLNGLTLLTEIFEDVMTDDMFFTNDIGIIIFKTIVDYVSTFSDIKILEQVLKLYASCITILTTSQVFIDYEDMVVNQLTDLNSAIITKFNNSNIPIQLESFKLWKTYFELIQLLRINVSKSITKENKSLLKTQILFHLQTATNIYLSNLDRYYDCIEFVDYVIVIISLLSMLLKNFNNETEFICDCLIKLNKLSNLKKEELLDVNSIVEDFFSKDLNINIFFLRDQIEVFFDNIDEQNKKISKQYQKILNDKILQALNSGIADEENCLSLLTNCIDKESNNANILLIVNKLYENINQLDQLTLIRLNYLAPQIIKNNGNLIEKILSFLIQKSTEDEYSKISLLMFVYKLDADINLPQLLLIENLNQLVSFLDSDNLYPMLEILLKISGNVNKDDISRMAQFDCLLKLIISNKEDLSNVIVFSLIDDILENIFSNASLTIFIEIANKYFNDLVKNISDSIISMDINSLKLSITILNNFINHFPKDVELPLDIIQFLLEPVANLITQILSSSDYDSKEEEDDDDDNKDLIEESVILLNNIIRKSDYKNISPFNTELLTILSNVLSSKISCNKIGTLTLTILTKMGNNFSEELLNNIILKIFELFISDTNENNFRLSEDLLKIICHLALSNVSYFINILSNYLNDQNMSKFFDKWFDIFESLRGVFLIKCNIIALINIYNTNILNNLIVKGDVKGNALWDQDRVITRSMSKKIEIEYEKISLAEKILQILSIEAVMQMISKNENGDNANNDEYEENGEDDDEEEGDDDDGWEDIDDNLNYNQLNDLVKYSFKEEEEEEDQSEETDSYDTDIDDENMADFKVSNKSTLQIITAFLKMNINTSQFHHIYENRLDQDQKADLTNILL